MKTILFTSLLVLTACSSNQVKQLPEIEPIGSIGSEQVVLEDGKAQLVERQALEAKLQSSRWWAFNIQLDAESENGILYHCLEQLALSRRQEDPPEVFKFKALKRQYTEKIGLLNKRLVVETRSDINEEIQLNESFRDSVEALIPAIKERRMKCEYKIKLAAKE